MSKEIKYEGKIKYDKGYEWVVLKVEKPKGGQILLPVNRHERILLEDIRKNVGKKKLEDLDRKEFKLKLTIED